MLMTQPETYVGTASFEERNQTLKALSNAAGLRLPETILPEGHALWEVGQEAQRGLKASVNALPMASDAIQALLARIQLEDPKDYPLNPRALRMSGDTGRLFREGKDGANAIGYTRTGFNHAVDAIRPSGLTGLSANLLALPHSIRAQAFNWHAQCARDASKSTVRTILEPKSGTRVVRAITSSIHSLETGDDKLIAETLWNDDTFKTAKARITREQNRSEFELIWPAMNRELVVGDVALMGCRIVNSETKAGSLRVEAFLLRVLCANFTTAESDDLDASDIAIRHVGDLRRKLTRALAQAISRLEPFVKAFGDAYQRPLTHTRGETLELVGKKFELPERVLTTANTVWNQDGEMGAGNTLAGLVNALTRASQLEPVAIAGEIERAAGRLVMHGV